MPAALTQSGPPPNNTPSYWPGTLKDATGISTNGGQNANNHRSRCFEIHVLKILYSRKLTRVPHTHVSSNK